MVIFRPIEFYDTDEDEREGKLTRLTLEGFIKDQIPTARFWLMGKLKWRWEKRWARYLDSVRGILDEQFELIDGSPEEKKKAIDKIIVKIERSAWATMPAGFLSSVGVPRALRI
jgi:hypothetical protein